MIDAVVYRLAARALFMPFGGVDALRRRVMDAMDVRHGMQVLELGCGPGVMTAELLRRGAEVRAVDSSAAMLRVARSNAPAAFFINADIRAYRSPDRFDAVLLAFVLHELRSEDVREVVRSAAANLAPGGRLLILDHAAPAGRAGGVWRHVLRVVESRAIDAWLDLSLRDVVQRVGLHVGREERLAGGRAQLMVGECPAISTRISP